MLNQELLKARLHYDPATGAFRWRPRSDRTKWWNTKHAGKQAGCTTAYGRFGDCAYVRINLNGHNYFAHRLAWLYMTGDWPQCEVDHRNGDGTSNRWLNLREATKAQNAANTGLGRNNRSGVKGVSWDADRGLWSSRIHVAGKHIHLGRFDVLEAAAAARRNAEITYQGDYARMREAA